MPDFHFSYLLFLLVLFFSYGVWRSRRTRKLETESNIIQQTHLFNWLELPLMDEYQFWRFIHRCSGSTPREMSNNIAIALTHLSASDVVSFDRRFRYYENELYTTTFCAAVNFLDDQAFVTTAARLIIAKGRVTYERVSEDADLIADYINYGDAHEDFDYGAAKAYGDKPATCCQSRPGDLWTQNP